MSRRFGIERVPEVSHHVFDQAGDTVHRIEIVLLAALVGEVREVGVDPRLPSVQV